VDLSKKLFFLTLGLALLLGAAALAYVALARPSISKVSGQLD
jgi:hypothetical protein